MPIAFMLIKKWHKEHSLRGRSPRYTSESKKKYYGYLVTIIFLMDQQYKKSEKI